MCKLHSSTAARLSTRIINYTLQCLRDKKKDLTRACVLLVSYLVLYITPKISGGVKTIDEKSHVQANWVVNVFNQFAKITDSLGEHAVQCMCAVILPVDHTSNALDEDAFAAHGRRISSRLSVIIASQTAACRWKDTTKTQDRLASICALIAAVRLARKLSNDSTVGLTAQVISCYPEIFQMIRQILYDSPRKEWRVRMHSLKLARLMLTIDDHTQSLITLIRNELVRAHNAGYSTSLNYYVGGVTCRRGVGP